MKPRNILAAAAAWGAIAICGPAAQAGAPSSSTDPGFVPQTGQINPGSAPAPWSAAPALPQDRQPSPEDARTALSMPDPVGVSSLGGGPVPAQTGDHATTGAAPATANAPPPGPIGATLQTMPAKYSQRNDLLDHLPSMAWPLRLNQQQRQQIYQSVMAQRPQPTEGIDKLKPASALSYEQTRHLLPLPGAVAGIDGLEGLKFLSGKDRVLLVSPANGVVVDQITM